jgi:hypothetical protein
MFLGFSDTHPDPLVRGTDQAKKVRKTLIPTFLWLLYDFLSSKNDVNVPSKSNDQKKIIFVDVLKISIRNAWIRIQSRTGILKTDPDPATLKSPDPQHLTLELPYIYRYQKDRKKLLLTNI